MLQKGAIISNNVVLLLAVLGNFGFNLKLTGKELEQDARLKQDFLCRNTVFFF